LNKLGA